MGALKELMGANNPSEIVAMLRYARQAKAARGELTASLDPHWRYAYESLCNVSRSFSLVIMQLEVHLRHPICIFYLVLRALDTVEDDTSTNGQLRQQICKKFYTFLPSPPKTSTERRLRLLSVDAPAPNHGDDIDKQKQDKKHTETETETEIQEEFVAWTSSEFGTGAEKELLQRFDEIVKCFSELRPEYQIVIANITRRMGLGMADHIHHVSCDTIDEYDLYCHYVAGLVGFGLTDIFLVSASNNSEISQQQHQQLSTLTENPYLANSMGLFLQKTNIIRDYLEDIIDGRTFWPQEIWSQYASSLDDLKDESNRKFALAALNHMVSDALTHAPHALTYMACISKNHPSVFKFVAIPQVMAMATLNEVYNNGNVFEGVVKLRRARTALLIQKSDNMASTYKVFFELSHDLLTKVSNNDPSSTPTTNTLKSIIESCVPHVPAAPNLIIFNVVSIVLFSVLSSYVLKRRQEHFDGAAFTWRSAGGIMEPLDMLAVGALFLVCVYMFGFFLLPYMTNLQQDDWRRLEQQRNVDNVNVGTRRCDRDVVELDEDGSPT